MAISSIPDPYKALGLTPEATAAEIRSAYKKLMLKCHPDKVHDESQKEEKAQQYQKVMEAYELLSDPKKKRRYDLDMQRQTTTESRPTNGTPTTTTDTTTKAEARDTSEEGKKEKSRERQRYESRQARREHEFEEYVKPRDVPREKESQREKEASREREAPKEKEVPKDREIPKERDVPREMPTRESDVPREAPREVPRETEYREKESSRDRDRSHKDHKDHKESREHRESKEYKDYRESKEYKEYRESKEYKEAREQRDHKHSRESSKEKERRHNLRPETSPPPSSDTLKSHQQKYEEEKRLEDIKLKAARARMNTLTPEPMAAPLGGGYHGERLDSARRWEEERLERERHEREWKRYGYDYEVEQKLRKNREAREKVRVPDTEELGGFNMEDIHPKPTESRRGSAQQREPSPKDSPATSRERKSSHSPSHRGGSNSPVRGESLHSSSRSIPIRTPYGSAPPPAANSTFAAPFPSVSPRRRHSVSSQDPMKAARLYPREDSGYSSPNHPSTPMGPDGRIPPLMRSSTESSDRHAGWYSFYVEDPEAAAAAIAAATGQYSMPVPGHMHRRKTTSHHPLETANLTSSPPLHSAEFRKAAPIPGSSSKSSAYYYPSTSAYYASSTHAPHHFSHSSGASSVHPQQSPTRSHSTRHSSSSSHNHSTSHSTSPHSSPKVAQEAFVSMDGVRSPKMSSASTVHPASGYQPSHYSRAEYFSPPVLPRGHTI